MKGLFITGTDTGIGKTVITASITRLLRSRGIDAIAVKPFATGVGPNTGWRENDPLLLSAATDYVEPAEVISPVRLPTPLSPYDAARLNHVALDVEAIISAVRQIASRHEFALVEGVGGVAVPLTENVMVYDFARMLQLNALVVSRSRIGTINHTMMTVSALRQAGAHVEGIVFNRCSAGEITLDEKVGPDTICRLARTACFGMVDRRAGLENADTLENAVEHLPTDDPAITGLADHILLNLM